MEYLQVTKQHHTGLRTVQRYIREGRAPEHFYTALLGLDVDDVAQLIRTIDRGLAYRTFETLADSTGLAVDEIADFMAIPRRTLARRREKGRFSPEESERMLRASRLFAKALQLFEGDPEAAKDWFNREQPGLGGARPSELGKTEIGAREVESFIDKLEHGVFA